VARAGVEAGCTEALFTLGDKPELLYDQAKHEVGLFLCRAVSEGQAFPLQYMI
jgi:2-iminoacetate synthase ThiH